MPRPKNPTLPRVGLRDIARTAGVCLMTASLSLRNSPKISGATRERVRGIAAKLGYRPDPEISRLMGRLRLSRTSRGGEVIALIDFRRQAEGQVHPYDVSIRKGITTRADALGYGTTVFRVVDYDGSLNKLMRVIRNRGITGVILLPSNQPPVSFDPDVSWEGLSIVSATTAVLSPRFHQVVPNQLYNMMTLIERLHEKGFCRIGAVLNETLELRTKHHYSLALTWHGHRDRILLLPHTTAVEENEDSVAAWLKERQPDVVVTQEADAVMALLRGLRLESQIALVSLSLRTDAKMPYQDQLPGLIGERAVSLVTGMMHNHETGVPEHPQVTTIDGVFCDPTAQSRTSSSASATTAPDAPRIRASRGRCDNLPSSRSPRRR